MIDQWNMNMDRASSITRLIQDSVPLSDANGFYVAQVSTDSVQCVLPFKASHTRMGNTISGPVMMTLADASMYAMILSLDDTQGMAVTQDFQIHFLARPAPKDLTAIVHILKNGKKTVVMRVDIFSDQQLVAHATGSYVKTPFKPQHSPDASIKAE
jgi:uncharacterized protein (TIGR00369 family)